MNSIILGLIAGTSVIVGIIIVLVIIVSLISER